MQSADSFSHATVSKHFSNHFISTFFPSDGENVVKKRASEKESVDRSPPEYVLPGCKDRPLTPLQPVRGDWKVRDRHFSFKT